MLGVKSSTAVSSPDWKAPSGVASLTMSAFYLTKLPTSVLSTSLRKSVFRLPAREACKQRHDPPDCRLYISALQALP